MGPTLKNPCRNKWGFHWPGNMAPVGFFLTIRASLVLFPNLINVHWQTMFLGMEQLRNQGVPEIRWWEVLRGIINKVCLWPTSLSNGTFLCSSGESCPLVICSDMLLWTLKYLTREELGWSGASWSLDSRPPLRGTGRRWWRWSLLFFSLSVFRFWPLFSIVGCQMGAVELTQFWTQRY